MIEFYMLLKNLLLPTEITAAVVGIIKFKKFKDSYWKWFIYYLVYIACSELICKFVLCYYENFRSYYYVYFVMQLEFLIFFWLYSYKSLNNKKLFWISSGVFLFSLLPYIIFEENNTVKSLNYTVGAFLLSIMIILEYNKQMKSDEILNFRENMMFYVNTGVGLFYVGTLPFYAFSSLLVKDDIIYFNYYLFFLFTNILMYALFSIALLWGKPNTY